MKIVTMHISLNKLSKKKRVKIVFITLFVLYILLFLTLTLFNRVNFKEFNWEEEVFFDYINNSTNFIPFKTIISYFKAFIKGNISTHLFLYNIFGNFIALMPFALFLPVIFKKQNKFWIFFLTIVITVILIEFIQFIIRVRLM